MQYTAYYSKSVPEPMTLTAPEIKYVVFPEKSGKEKRREHRAIERKKKKSGK